MDFNSYLSLPASGACDHVANVMQTVDWINGQAVLGDNESQILKMLKQLPEDENKKE